MTTKISALPARSAVATTDIIPVVDAASGTPATQKATVAQLRAAMMPIGSVDITPAGTNGFVLTTVGGVTSWAAAAAGGSPAGSSGELQYNNSGSFGGATNVKAGAGFISIAATPAASGDMRLANTFNISRRNGTNSADETIIAATATTLSIGGPDTGTTGQFFSNLALNAFGSCVVSINGTSKMSIDSSGVSLSGITVTGTSVKCNSGTFISIDSASAAASAGQLRIGNAGEINFRNVGNTADICAINVDSSNRLRIGIDGSFGKQAGSVWIFGANDSTLGVGSTTYIACSSGTIAIGAPIVGNASPLGVHGTFSKTLTAAQNYVLGAGEYAMSDLQFVTSGANIVQLPACTTSAGTYYKFVQNVSGGGTLTVKDTAANAAAAALASGNGAWFRFSNGAVKQVTAAFTVA